MRSTNIIAKGNYMIQSQSQAPIPQSQPGRIAAVRQFSRFYTRQIGVLREKPYESRFSLTEVRVLYELAHREKPTASELSKD
jgi:hypothetical protein